jgi:hypothetical protein
MGLDIEPNTKDTNSNDSIIQFNKYEDKYNHNYDYPIDYLEIYENNNII